MSEGALAELAEQFLVACRKGETRAVRDAERSLASGVSRLVGDLLSRDRRWDSRRRWIDDLSVYECRANPDGQIEMTGVIIWGKGGTTQQWIEPCRVRFLAIGRELEAYEIYFGDAERSGPLEYGGSGKNTFPAVEPEWLCVFTRNADRLAQ